MITKIEEIPLEKFDLSLSGMRIMNISRIEQVARSMHLHGQLQPVVARHHEERYMLIDGFKRYYNAVDLMMETLQCLVLDIDLTQAKVLLMSYNRIHQSMDTWEEAMVLRDLQKTHSLNQVSLAKLTGYSRSWVSRRLSLIERIDEKVSSEIMMGALTSSHARVLIKLPRGNQADVARVIIDCGLSSRQSNTLVEAFLAAENEDQRRYVLNYPEQILWNDLADSEQDPYDARLSGYGNDLMISLIKFFQLVRTLLLHLDNPHIAELNETEKVIINPFIREVSSYAEKLSGAIGQLHIHQPIEQNER